MTDDRRSGVALIAGSAGMIITMILHPTGKVGPEGIDAMVRMLVGVHALALASMPVVFLGAWGLSRRVASADRLAMMALVLYAFATVAVMNAAVFDGLVAPNLIRQIVFTHDTATAGTSEGWRLAFNYNSQLNQAFARVYAVASSMAILLWSVVIVRDRALARGVGIYGCVLGAITVAGVFSGRLNPDVHGFGLIIFGQALWFILSGASLCRDREG
ncbi:MAG TPA: hypothetical protein VG051_05140 [Candidatus Acidoferrum sp.]|jgi:hypothetical protein|nr:hypothetical protein [Candidatus Acidoferrum sp.]